MPPKDKYTDPELREKVKEEVQAGDKGGAPGQWSARKAQMVASQYKKRGGEYNQPKSEKDASQKHLDKWTEEDWQTKEGSGEAKQEDGTRKRYLPKKAWENLDEREKEDTEQKKIRGGQQGKQHVANTGKAKEARKNAQKGAEGSKDGEPEGEEHEAQEENADQDTATDDGGRPDDDTEYVDEGESVDMEDVQDEEVKEEFGADADGDGSTEEEEPTHTRGSSRKRGPPSEDRSASTKKQKDSSSTAQPAERGSGGPGDEHGAKRGPTRSPPQQTSTPSTRGH